MSVTPLMGIIRRVASSDVRELQELRVCACEIWCVSRHT
jgi:hypothetical protein